MAFRVTESRIKKWMILTGLVGVPLGFALVLFMSSSGMIEVIDYTGDIVSNESIVFIELTFKANEDIFIYPMNYTWGLSTTPEVKQVKLYRTWGESLRELKMNKTCTGRWCGCYWCTSSNTAKYIYVFRKGREYTLVYEIHKEPNATIKWGWLNNTIDPFIVGYENVYSIKKAPIYKDFPIPIYEITKETLKNKSVVEHKKLIGYETKQSPIFETVIVDGRKTRGKIIGYITVNITKERKVGYELVKDKNIGTKISKKIINNSYVYNNQLIKYTIPIGDRNLDEFGECRKYEIEKGVCQIVNLTKVAYEIQK